MKQSDMMQRAAHLAEETKAALLATVDGDGKPHMRWMEPAFLKGRPGTVFCITAPDDEKVDNLKNNPYAQWQFQTPALDEIVTVSGKVNILNNPAIRSEIIQALAGRLTAFWRLNKDLHDFIVLEMVAEEGCYYLPMKAEKEEVCFGKEES